MNAKNRWHQFAAITLIAAAFGAADAWSHRTPRSCPACEFEALRQTRVFHERANDGDPKKEAISGQPSAFRKRSDREIRRNRNR